MLQDADDPVSNDLPNFENPPVVEVALAIQFATPVFDPITLGAYWAQIRGEFPNRDEQPPLAPMIEDFGAPTPGEPIRIELMNRLPMPRYWFLTGDQAELIQVQDDRFGFNWRKTPEGDSYPRYPALRAKFDERLRQVLSTLEDSGEAAVPCWCEVTYINHLGPDAETGGRPDLASILRVFQSRGTDFPPTPEDTQFGQRFLIPGAEGASGPIGRLYVSVASAFRVVDLAPIYVMTLTARGRPLTEDLEGALAFLDLGRKWIVRSFKGITTDNMHAAWQEVGR